MEKTIRCTICTWRGPWELADSAPRIRASEIPPALEDLQNVYEEVQETRSTFGSDRPPPCPMCGHHTINVKLHGYRAAI